ncbi:MAG TPA: hypothetical protein VGQ35_15765 [Dongiaceae bacterium]|nr:hypothetical protein [Dongiaceae bacterium]
MLSKIDLWQRIRDFEMDGAGDAFQFSQRLSRENGWTRDYALGAIEEYKKFIYLICVSDGSLTPSEAVDQVWHLHLVYTRSYWTRFCNEVLGRPLHHEPTKGGQAQARLFHDQYAATCVRYEEEFGCAPPATFWPPLAERFAAAPRLQWVDRRRHWLVAKPTGFGSGLRWAAVPVILLATSASVAAKSEAGGSNGISIGSFVVFGVFVLVSWLITRARRGKKDDESSGWWGTGGGCGGGESGGGCGSGCGGGCGGCGG